MILSMLDITVTITPGSHVTSNREIQFKNKTDGLILGVPAKISKDGNYIYVQYVDTLNRGTIVKDDFTELEYEIEDFRFMPNTATPEYQKLKVKRRRV